MICLAIDCAFPDAVIALSDGERILMRQFGPQRSHALSIIGELERLLAEANVKAEQLDRIGVGQGPGSFTGLRVALATATGIAQGASADLVGFSTFDALPLSAEPTLYAFDARQGRAYVGLRAGEVWSVPPQAMDVSAALELKTRANLLHGNASKRYPELSEGMSALERAAHIDPLRALALTEGAPTGKPVLPTYKEGAQAQVLFGSPELGRALDGDELDPT